MKIDRENPVIKEAKAEEGAEQNRATGVWRRDGKELGVMERRSDEASKRKKEKGRTELN